ncbi:hypothetical protein N4R57_21020 [Rhodobacteraceae bacterium D3-12]|nr:hypothetical protein N4R57_21020 [Rhodobacteraceae bacterium D3-12]
MSNNEIDALKLLEQALQRGNDRNWSERTGSQELTKEEATKFVAKVLSEQLTQTLGSKDPGSNIMRGLLVLQDVFKTLPPSEEDIVRTIECSQHDYHAFWALRFLATLKIAPNSTALQRWQSSFLSGAINEPPLPKGPYRDRDAHRNMLIVSQIKQLEQIGFRPTRNDASTHQNSGCDIVADALQSLGKGMSYSAVERVWKERDKLPQPKYIADLLIEFPSLFAEKKNTSD